MKEYLYSETFFSFQGEGKYVGVPSAWLRTFSCNLQCNGFGQDNPVDESTYDLPYKDFDPLSIKDITELPVFSKGCDSSYSWSKKYKHLMYSGNAKKIASDVRSHLPNQSFNHKNGMNFDFVITGGEPLINQNLIIEVLQEFINDKDYPERVTIETNGTKLLTQPLIDFINHSNIKFFFSISPKLYHVSGEKPEKAIKHDVLKQLSYFPHQLKFVVNGKDEAWKQIENILDNVPIFAHNVYIMGVGGTLEGLKVTESSIADEAINRGYNYTSRVHVHVYGNQIAK